MGEPTDSLELALQKCCIMAGELDATVDLLTVAWQERHPDSRHRMVAAHALGSTLSMRSEMRSLLEYVG